MKEEEQNIKQFLADKFTKKWQEENDELMKDAENLCNEAVMFKLKWGFPVKIVFDKYYKEVYGREMK